MVLFAAAAAVGILVWAWGAFLHARTVDAQAEAIEARFDRDHDLRECHKAFVEVMDREPSATELWRMSPPTRALDASEPRL